MNDEPARETLEQLEQAAKTIKTIMDNHPACVFNGALDEQYYDFAHQLEADTKTLTAFLYGDPAEFTPKLID
jgi:hypothetical protein